MPTDGQRAVLGTGRALTPASCGLEGNKYGTGGNTKRVRTMGRNSNNNPRVGQRVHMRETHQRLTPMGEEEGRERVATAS